MKAKKFSKKVINIQLNFFIILIVSVYNFLLGKSINKNREEVFKLVNKKKETLVIKSASFKPKTIKTNVRR
jgi:hypothetical protein